MPEKEAPPRFGLYVHWPFCKAKCPYCDFNSHVVTDLDAKRWKAAFLREIRYLAQRLPPRRLHSIFFGGGTPSLMPPNIAAAIIDAATEAWPPEEGIEITLEANPTSTEAASLSAFRSAGVNRVSIGVQALDDQALRLLGRQHSTREALAALDLARRLFPRTSFDLIYARQHQSLAAWEAELAQALRLGPDHLSLYQLTIEPGTAFGARAARGTLPGLPDEDLAADMYELTQELCAAEGLMAYEISNHARPGAQSRHNLLYWRNQDWAGIGPGAHGRLSIGNNRHASISPRQPDAWLDQVETQGRGHEPLREMGPAEIASEALLMGLRLHEGMPVSRLPHPCRGEDLYNKINGLMSLGLVSFHNGILCATARGRMLLNTVITELMPEPDGP